MCTYFKTETDVAQNLIDGFFSNFDSSIGRILSEKKKKKKNTGVLSYFPKKRKLGMQNLTK